MVRSGRSVKSAVRFASWMRTGCSVLGPDHQAAPTRRGHQRRLLLRERRGESQQNQDL